MYRALDVANYVINRYNENNISITNLKLQKVLYYIQAAFLVERGPGCFKDEIMCWRHGPVIQSVYNKFSKYGSEIIPRQEQKSQMVFDEGKWKFESRLINKNDIDIKDRNLIDKVADGLASYEPWYLVDRTHEEDPWKNLEYYNVEITQESIRRYFENHPERMYGDFN